jgi:hypothetical protein
MTAARDDSRPMARLTPDLDNAHRHGVAAAANGLQDPALGRRRLTGPAVDELAEAAVTSATPFLRAPLLSRLAAVRTLHHPTTQHPSTCPTCKVPVPCPTTTRLAW